MRGVCNILVAEFLSDVHVICEQCRQNNDTQPLQSYLLSGRGCIILHVLSTLGLQVSDLTSFCAYSVRWVCR